MADIGYTAMDGAVADNIEGWTSGIVITMPEEGTVDSVTLRLAESSDANAHAFKVGIYSADGSSLIDQSAQYSDIGTTPEVKTVTGFSGATLSAATDYVIMVFGGQGAGVLNIYKDNVTDAGVSRGSSGFTAGGSIPSDISATLTTTGNENDIYLTYSPTSAPPTISDITPSTVTPSSNLAITLTNGGDGTGSSAVTISPTDDVADVNAVTATVGGGNWTDTLITTTGTPFPTGTAHNDTLYLFVTNDTGDSNAAGSAVTASLAPTIHTGTVVNPSAGGFSVRFTSDVANGTAYYVVFQTTASDPNAAQIVAGTDGDGGAAVAQGSMAISTTGEQTFPATTGLTQSVTYRVAVVHYGDSSA